MRWVLFSLALIVLLHASLSIGQTCENPSVDEKDLVCLPPPLLQGDSNWCFLYSSYVLLEQHNCLSKPSRPNSELSLRGIIEVYNQRNVEENVSYVANQEEIPAYDTQKGGFIYSVLSAASGKPIASEQCAPTKDFLSWQQSLPKLNAVGLSASQLLKFQYHEYLLNTKLKGQSELQAKCQLSNEIQGLSKVFDLASFARDVSEAAAASEAGSANEFMELVLVPARCASSSIDVGGLKLRTSDPSTSAMIQKNLVDILSSGKAVGVSLCSTPLFSGPHDTGCGPHALVVAGYRKSCCGSVCNLELKVVDSSPSDGKLESAQQWYPATRIALAIIANQKERLLTYGKQQAENDQKKLIKLNRQLAGFAKDGYDRGSVRKFAMSDPTGNRYLEFVSTARYRQFIELSKQTEELYEKIHRSDALTWIDSGNENSH